MKTNTSKYFETLGSLRSSFGAVFATTKGSLLWKNNNNNNNSHLLHNSSQVLNQVIWGKVLSLNNMQSSLYTEPAVVWVSGEGLNKLSVFAGICHAH